MITRRTGKARRAYAVEIHSSPRRHAHGCDRIDPRHAHRRRDRRDHHAQASNELSIHAGMRLVRLVVRIKPARAWNPPHHYRPGVMGHADDSWRWLPGGNLDVMIHMRWLWACRDIIVTAPLTRITLGGGLRLP